ncbi:GTPase [Spongiivirga sp. MCCC 1A20706]|uniref:GTPase n=1 Tax=Spongiivirga sp. MCCC 1A20706 TaxID=3160963 RepID=UPI003977B3F3
MIDFIKVIKEIQKILFVYNAKSGFVNGLFDAGHKLLSPQTYQCSLCSLTHGAFKERTKWKQFRENTQIQLAFLHIDEFQEQYEFRENDFSYPVVLVESKGKLVVILDDDRLRSLNNVEDLIKAVEKYT